MSTEFDPTIAILVLLGSTAAWALGVGVALPYLIAAHEAGERTMKIWLVWVASLASVYLWASVTGYAAKTPGILGVHIFLALVIGLGLFVAVFLRFRKKWRRKFKE